MKCEINACRYIAWLMSFHCCKCNRFVRFVSTPEVLERFVTIEKEILQIENSLESCELAEAEGTLWIT